MKIMAGCKPFSVNLAVLAPDNKRQISFGITRGCLDSNTPFYVLNFILRDKVGDDFQDRVSLHVTVGDTDNDKAQRIMAQGLTLSQLSYLQGPVTNKAKKLPANTTSDPSTEKVIGGVVNVK
jgi:hypothetical protein